MCCPAFGDNLLKINKILRRIFILDMDVLSRKWRINYTRETVRGVRMIYKYI
jgi:hypothetical protein